MNRHVNTISARLSLRPPQRRSLEILARISEIISLEKGANTKDALETIKSEFGRIEDFERDFPSLCFSLATGVGKTRLMGAFIAYLHLEKDIRHFFVLAPNLTIYNKLIADFSPESPKYVLKGIAEFANTPPEIITGDNYESGRGIREERRTQPSLPGTVGSTDPIHINIFNISKINSEVRGGRAPRIKRLSEYIGESYFNYLAELDDLVLLMDESHRYRGSAGINAINELKPILGLELTATPQVEAGQRTIPFKNVIYNYPLSQALTDGFVKEPAVATREDFNPLNHSAADLEDIKLSDGIRIHESTKVDLETYTKQNDLPPIKPFMLIVARDTDHAETLVRTMKSDDFFEGRYRDKVITVHSNQRGEESDETVARLLAIENPQEQTEIVVHVNMLKEGWDVTNLYTIVPLRAANSRTLVEQSIGRGLRLPFGKRVGVSAVDRLTIVAHDKFSEIVDEANRPDSVLKVASVYIGKDVAIEERRVVTVAPALETALFGNPTETGQSAETPTETGENSALSVQQKIVFENPIEREIAQTTLEVIRRFEYKPSSNDLRRPEVQAEIIREVKENLPGPAQVSLTEIVKQPNFEEIARQVTEKFIEMTIDTPKIIVVPTGETIWTYRDFDLDTTNLHIPPTSHNILLQSLQTNKQERLADKVNGQRELMLENYLVKRLIDFDDISYDDHADLLYKLSRQTVNHLRSYMPDETAVCDTIQFENDRLAKLIYAQMLAHQSQNITDFEVTVTKGFTTLRNNNYTVESHENARNFRAPVETRQNIRSMHFGGFQKCLYPLQKFDSDSERRFSIVLENDTEVLKWFKPAKGQLPVQIFPHQDRQYEPDFVVETKSGKFLCEVKREDELEDGDVQSKKTAAEKWCENAARHETENGGKPWRYILISHNSILGTSTFAGIVSSNV